jgi:hypothetical protein
MLLPPTGFRYWPDLPFSRAADPVYSRQSGLGSRITVGRETVEGTDILVICRGSKHRELQTFADYEPVGQPLFVKVAGRYRAPEHNGGVKFSVGKVTNKANPTCLFCEGKGTLWGGCFHCWSGTPLWEQPWNHGKAWLLVGCEASTDTQWVRNIAGTREGSRTGIEDMPEKGISYQEVMLDVWLRRGQRLR